MEGKGGELGPAEKSHADAADADTARDVELRSARSNADDGFQAMPLIVSARHPRSHHRVRDGRADQWKLDLSTVRVAR